MKFFTFTSPLLGWLLASCLVVSMGYGQTQLLTPIRLTAASSGLDVTKDTIVPILRRSYASINFATKAPFLPDQIGFNLFDDVNLVAQRVESEILPDGTETWYGRIPDPEFDHLSHYRNVVITANATQHLLIATIFYKGKEYEIKPLPLGSSTPIAAASTSLIHQVIEVGKVSAMFCDSTLVQSEEVTKNARVAAGETDCKGVYIVDVFVGFSTAAARRFKDINIPARQMINVVNNGLRNSLVSNVKLRLVGVGIKPNNPGIVGAALRNGPTWFAAEMRATGADYLALVQNYSDAPNQPAGLAYVGGNVSVQASFDPDWIFRHEMGHNVGGHHCRGSARPAYAYGFGPTHMCGNSTNFYSNPNVMDRNGNPIGNATTANMARLWRERAQAMANRRTHVLPYACLSDNCPTPTITARGLGTKLGLVLLSEVMVPTECVRLNTTWSSLNGRLATRPVEIGRAHV